jgi:uncharacterized protein YacL
VILFDLALLLFASGLLAIKSLFLGSVTLVIGLLIGFQNIRTMKLLGISRNQVSLTRKVKAAILAIILGLCAFPLLFDSSVRANFEVLNSEEAVLPVIIVIGLMASALMAALVVEKRKR